MLLSPLKTYSKELRIAIKLNNLRKHKPLYSNLQASKRAFLASYLHRHKSQESRLAPVKMTHPKPPYIDIQDNSIYSLYHFCIPDHYQDDVESILIPHGLVIDR
jgi:hypothetical protein